MYIYRCTYMYMYVYLLFFFAQISYGSHGLFSPLHGLVPRRALGMGMSSLIIALGAETCDWQSCPKIYWNIDQYRSYRIDIEEQLERDYREAGKMVQRMNESKLQEPFVNSTTSHLSFRLFFVKRFGIVWISSNCPSNCLPNSHPSHCLGLDCLVHAESCVLVFSQCWFGTRLVHKKSLQDMPPDQHVTMSHVQMDGPTCVPIQ